MFVEFNILLWTSFIYFFYLVQCGYTVREERVSFAYCTSRREKASESEEHDCHPDPIIG
jgi:hypothetical protein